jgi:hypothetical protein
LRIGQLGIHFQRPRLRIQRVGDPRDLARQDLVGKSDEHDRHRLADPNEPDKRLQNVGSHPDRAQVGDRHEGCGGVRGGGGRGPVFSRRDVDLQHASVDRCADQQGLVKFVRLELEYLEFSPGLLLDRARDLVARSRRSQVVSRLQDILLGDRLVLVEVADALEVSLDLLDRRVRLTLGRFGLKRGRHGGVGVGAIHREQRLSLLDLVAELHHHVHDPATHLREDARDAVRVGDHSPRRDHLVRGHRRDLDRTNADLLELGGVGRNHDDAGSLGGGRRGRRGGCTLVVSMPASRDEVQRAPYQRACYRSHEGTSRPPRTRIVRAPASFRRRLRVGRTMSNSCRAPARTRAPSPDRHAGRPGSRAGSRHLADRRSP